MATTEERYRAATEDFTKATGLPFFDLVDGCCRSCISAETLGIEKDTDYAYTSIGQAKRLIWDNGDLYYQREEEYFPEDYEEEEEPESLDWEIQDMAFEIIIGFTSMFAAEALVTSFEEHGFTVDWDGTPYIAISVILHDN